MMGPRDLAIWQAARPYLDVRNNDEHTIVAYAVAQTLLSMIPEADEAVVLPAILLHDVGWKRIPQDLLLDAVGRHPTRRDLVYEHERHSVVIARGILEQLDLGLDTEAILHIIDGHDTTHDAKNINDAVLKDADKCWRTTPHGMAIIRAWYDSSLADYLDMVTTISNPRLLTDAGRAMAQGFTASLKAELELIRYLEAT